MSRTRIAYVTLAIAVAALFVGGLRAATVHPYHVSLTEMEWNQERETLEVALWVWPADLEKGLAGDLKRPVDLDTEKKLDEQIAKYLGKRFTVTNKDNQKLKIRWVGHEKNLKQAWLYFEVTGVTAGTKVDVSNRIFFDLNEDQLNQLNAKIGVQEKRLTMTQAKNKYSLEIPAAAEEATATTR